MNERTEDIKMQLNMKKCDLIKIQKHNKIKTNSCIGGIELKKEMKYLGLIIDGSLKFNT